MDLEAGHKLTGIGVVPDDWVVRRLGDIASLHRHSVNPASFADQRFVHFSLPAFDDGKRPVVELGSAIGSNKFRVPNEAVLVSKLNPRIPRVWAPQEIPPDAIASTEFLVLEPREGTSRGYLFVVCSSPAFTKQLELSVSGTTGSHQRVSPSLALDVEVPFPPDIREQAAIAAIRGDLDTLIDGLDQLIAKKRDVKQAAMQQLLTGTIRLPGFHGKWEVKLLGDVVDTDPDNLESETQPDFAFKYIALDDVDRGSLRNHSEVVFANAPSRARRKLRTGDVLVSTVRPNLQSHLLFREGGSHWVCSTGFCVVRCREGVTNPGYVYYHLFASCVNRQIVAVLTGSNYPAISSGDVRALEVPLPAYVEQAAIAEVLSDMDAELTALEQRREKTRALKQAMMQELLTGKTRLV